MKGWHNARRLLGRNSGRIVPVRMTKLIPPKSCGGRAPPPLGDVASASTTRPGGDALRIGEVGVLYATAESMRVDEVV
jgi:hypothetical protein